MAFHRCKNFENQLRFDRVIATDVVLPFFRDTVYNHATFTLWLRSISHSRENIQNALSPSLKLVSDRAAHPVYYHSCSRPRIPPMQTPGHSPSLVDCNVTFNGTSVAVQQGSSSRPTAHSVRAHFDCLVGSLSTLFCVCVMLMQYITLDRLSLIHI